MVLNGYTVLSVFFCLLRLLLSLVVVTVGIAAWRLSRQSYNTDRAETIENRSYLLMLAATVLIGMNVASWPLLYLVLQSYVPQWPGVMCIYGVTKIGAGTMGASRFLPVLLTGLHWTKPLLVFLSGSGYVLYLINRRTRTAQIQRRVVLVVLLMGGGSLVDSLLEGAYLTVPKTEILSEGGCCTNALEIVQQASKFDPRIHLNASQRPYLIATYYGLNLALIAGLFVHVIYKPPQSSRIWQWPLLIAGLLSIPIGLLFLVEVAAPAILGLPFHHCAYDLITAAPESVLSVILLLGGCFSVGWSSIAGRFGRCDQSQEFLQEHVSRLLFFALFGYTGSLLVITIELYLA